MTEAGLAGVHAAENIALDLRNWQAVVAIQVRCELAAVLMPTPPPTVI